MVFDILLAESLHNGGLDAALDLLGLVAHHRGLVGHANGCQVFIRIKANGVIALKLFQERLFVAALDDIFTNSVRLLKVANNKVMSVIGGGLADRGFGLLVSDLAVDDAGDLILRVCPYTFPHTHHVAAGGVHKLAPLGFEFLEDGHLRAERRNNDDVILAEVINIRHFVGPRQKPNAHVANLVVYLRVMNDFPKNI